MSTEGAPQSQLPTFTSPHQPIDRKGSAWVRIVVYVVVIGLLAVIGWRIYQGQQAQKQAAQGQAKALAGQKVPVQVAPVEAKPMPIFLTALGTVTPYMSVTVKARVNGELLPVKFTEGQLVKQGETIMTIDPKPYQAALDQAKGTLAHDEALLKNAQAEFARYKALFAAGVVSKETLDADESAQGQYQGAIESDKAAIETAQLQLVDPGNIITANTTNLVIINQFQPIAVYFTLPEGNLPEVLKKLSSDKRLPVDAYDQDDTKKLTSGYLLTADNQIDTTTGTDKLKAVFENKDSSLFPNQFVNIHLTLENRPNALVVPSAAIQSGNQGAYVWVVSTDDKGAATAKIQLVKVALAEGQITILDSGVEKGQSLVVDGADRLRNGQAVVASVAKQHTGNGGGSGQVGGKQHGSGAGQSSGSGTGKPATKVQQ
jgi:multidrug efflux system membrane fusion protein